MRIAPRVSASPLRLSLALAMILVAAPISAQEVGGRIGASLDPDQFYFGVHFETDPVVERVHFRPNVEIGLGNNATVVALNFELVYRFPSRQRWSFYAGGGPALNIIDTYRDTEAEGGLTIVGGVEHGQGLFFEIKAGLLNSPDVKLAVGYVFR